MLFYTGSDCSGDRYYITVLSKNPFDITEQALKGLKEANRWPDRDDIDFKKLSYEKQQSFLAMASRGLRYVFTHVSEKDQKAFINAGFNQKYLDGIVYGEHIMRYKRGRHLPKAFIDGELEDECMGEINRRLGKKNKPEIESGKGGDEKYPLLNTADHLAYLHNRMGIISGPNYLSIKFGAHLARLKEQKRKQEKAEQKRKREKVTRKKSKVYNGVHTRANGQASKI